jgi:regulator of sigma E protease
LDFLTNLIPSFGNIAFTMLFFVIALSIIVAIHEYGHYIIGRWSGIHADVFSIGFGKVIWSGTDKRGTVWQIAALPFGGYVKFKGDSNATSVGGDDNVVLARDTMLGAPLWARSATVAAGPVFNFILSFIIFSGILLFQGQPITPLTVSALPAFPENIEQQLEPGDRILKVEGVALNYPEGFGAAVVNVPSQSSVEYEVEREGERMLVRGPQPQPAYVQSITPRSAADA